MSDSRRRGLARTLVGALATVAVVATGLGATGAALAAPPTKPTGTDPASKIKPDLMDKLNGKDAKAAADYWVYFGQKADLSAASKISDWTARGTAVAEKLRETATATQKNVKAELDAKGVKYKSFWATNAIRINGGSFDLAKQLAAHTEVAGLYNPMQVEVPKITEGTPQNEVNAVEWGVANIKANQVWSQFGDTGAGIVIANIDTGVQFDHPALVKQYRGNLGNGTFDHNYNWFDAAGTSPNQPADGNGHGTHTMGTMVGDDGAGNQIGVAPGVKWIAANGCCPTDEALIASGQWMLQPTNLAGANPDASKRPNVINNSWGSQLPSNDPFMEDVTLAWTASGIFGAFSNGNSGPSCATSGSPGSSTSNYSVGAYDINNAIASFSGRGAGQNGTIKPNIAAPGVNVRSSLPGNTYGAYNGTSMASPHMAGAIALLWSASPTLKGDVAATRALLNQTAIDTPATQCGGTTENNNVFGQGRLDALALVSAAPVGNTGTLSGKVTAATGGAALAGATVTVKSAGQPDKVLTTNSTGTFSSVLPAATYDLTVASFGYKSQTSTAVVTTGQTTTKNFALASSPQVSIGGTITDGSGHGWPLYSKVSVEGPGGVFDYTTPSNGRYSFKVPGGAAYKLNVQTQLPGYQTISVPVTVGTGNVTKNIAVPVRDDACLTAPGYKESTEGATQSFDGTTAPAGWTVVDGKGNSQVWAFDDPGKRGNLTGGTGGFATIDSDKFGSGQNQDTSLVSPVVDLSGVDSPKLRFNQDLRYLSGEKADVDVTVDGGATWINVLRQTAQARGPVVKDVALPQAANKSAVQVRFRYYDASYDWWWQVDNVMIGKIFCEPTGGGLVVGNVKDANTGGAVNGAVVTRDGSTESGTTVATPEDTGLADGFYWLYSSADGDQGFTAKAGNYVSAQSTVSVEADWVTSADYTLDAGQLSVTPGDIGATLPIGGKTSKNVTVTNTGGAPVKVKFGEKDGGFVLENANGSKTTKAQVLTGKGAPLQRLNIETSFAQQLSGKSSPAPDTNAPAAAPWTGIANYPSVVMDNRVVTVDGTVYSVAGGNGTASTGNSYKYDAAAKAWTAIAPLPGARNAVTLGVVNGKIIASSGWGASGPDAATWSYDPAANAWSALAANPAPRAGAGQAVAGGKLYAVGGCTTADCLPMSNTVVSYDPGSNTWATLASYPKSAAFISCGAIDGKVYCAGGNDGTNSLKNAYVYDPGANSWTAVADAPADHWAGSYAVAGGKLLVVGGVQAGAVTNAGFAYDPASNTWAALPNANQARYRGGAACGFYKVGGSSGGFTATADSENLPGLEDCSESTADVSWLSLDKTEAELAPGESTTVKVSLNANVDQPGTYTGAVTIGEDTPYSVNPVDIKLTVTPPSTWAKIQGTVTGVSKTGATAALPGATVEVDSWAQSYTFTTDAAGQYAYWLDIRNNPLTLIAAKDGYKPQTRTTELESGSPITEDFALKATK